MQRRQQHTATRELDRLPAGGVVGPHRAESALGDAGWAADAEPSIGAARDLTAHPALDHALAFGRVDLLPLEGHRGPRGIAEHGTNDRRRLEARDGCIYSANAPKKCSRRWRRNREADGIAAHERDRQ